jgi:hypothetical protein
MSSSPEVRFEKAAPALHEAAARSTGLEDFGDSSYRANLQAYLAALDEAGRATDAGRATLLAQVQGLLESRLHLQAGLKAHPRVRANPIVAPVFILGLPRTGTTALHNLMMCDPQFQGLQAWLAQQPMPRPPRDGWRDHPAFQRCQAGIDGLNAAVPEMVAMHWMAADAVEECRAVMTQGFANTSLSWPSDIPGYAAWLARHDMTPEYRHYADALRLIGANEPHKTWLLKCPHHCISADKLLAVFPDAKLVFLHRDPVSVVPSISSMVYRLRRNTEGGETRAERCGEQLLAHMESALRRLLAVRRDHPDSFVDLRFVDLMRDPVGSIAAIYDHFRLTLTGETMAGMQDWLAANPRGKHGEHRHGPGDFGLSAEQIRERFHGYHGY